MSQIQGIRANEKPVGNDFSYVYAENKDKGFIKVTKAMMKVLLGVATKLSELENDENFVDNTVSNLKNYYLKTETYSKEELDDKIALIPKFSVKVVYALPFDDISETTIYLVPANDGAENLYTEYINVNGLWEILGTQKVPKVEVTKESIESALGYTPADNAEFRQLSDTVNDKVTNPTSGAIGQILEIATVDENGKPKTYKAVNKPIGNGGSADLTGYATENYVKEYAQPKGDYLTSSNLSDAVNAALAQAKASGEFDGKDGEDGKDGYTPVKGTDYWTEADKAEIKSYVDEAIIGGEW